MPKRTRRVWSRVVTSDVAILLCCVSTLAYVMVSGGAASATPAAPGYWLEAGDGGVFAYGVHFEGSAASDPTRCPANPPGRSMPNGSCWSMAATPDGAGYWILNAYSGDIFSYGDAVSYGQPADTSAYSGGADTWPSSIDIVATPDGNGYWVLEEGLSGLGSVQSFGDAVNYGDETTTAHGRAHAGKPVAMVATHDGKGYWIVDSDGGMFSFGDAVFRGSVGNKTLNAPVVGAAVTADGNGYWLAAADGGVFSFGDATYGGSMANTVLAAPVVGIAANASGAGYWLAAADGGVFALGGAPYLGSLSAPPSRPTGLRDQRGPAGEHMNRPSPSVFFDQAENGLHTIKAVKVATLEV